MGISITDLKPSKSIIYNDELYIVINCEHAKLGRGSSFCRTKLRNLRTTNVLEVTLRDSDKIDEAFIDRTKLQYLYRDDTTFHFIHQETFEDLVLDQAKVGDKSDWLIDNLELIGLFYENELLDLELPKTLEFEVIETDPGCKGDTVKMVLKPAKLQTGAIVQVPAFINIGDIIKVNTDKREYVGRA